MLQRRDLVGATLLLLATSAVSSAQTGVALTRAGSGARAAGMGDAFVAVSDDGTAASWNPAGLAQLRQPEISLVYAIEDQRLHLAGQRSADDSVAFSSQSLHDATASPDFISAALPFSVGRKPVTLQLGWHRLYRLGGQSGGDTNAFPMRDAGALARSVGLSDQVSGNIDVLSLAGAVKLTSRASLGVSYDFWRGDWSERLSVVEQPPAPAPTAFFAQSSRQRLRGRNVSVGLLLSYPAWNIGLVYHAPFRADMSLFQNVHSSRGPVLDLDAPRARFRLPRSLAGGVARRLGSRWTAAVALTHDQWTQAVLDRVPHIPGEINFFDGLPPEISTTRDALSINAGVEHLFVNESSVIPLRLGVGWEPQGAMDPLTRDPVEFFLVSGGGGFNTNRFKFDAAVQYRTATQRVSNIYFVDSWLAGGLTRDAIGRATVHEWRIKVSAIYRIADTAKLRGVLRRIFGMTREGAQVWFQKGLDALALAHTADYASECKSDREDAVAAFDKAINQDPDHADAWFLKSAALAWLERHEEALSAAVQVVRLRPDDHEAWLHAATALAELGRHEEALAACDRVLALQPAHLEAAVRRATALGALARHEAALEAWELVLRSRPEDSQATACPHSYFHFGVQRQLRSARLRRADTLAQLQRSEDALTAYREALLLAEQHQDGWPLPCLREFREARQAFVELVLQDPPDTHPWRRIGDAFRCAQRLDDAFDAYERALDQKPDDAEAWCGKAEAFVAASRRDEAIAAFRRALEIQPDHKLARIRLGVVLAGSADV